MRAAVWILSSMLVATTLVGASCKRHGGDLASSEDGDEELPPLVLRDSTPDLMLTWIDDRGETHVSTSMEEVPRGARSFVRVVVGDSRAGTGRLFYVADLTTKNDDGSYVVRVVPRSAWEAEIERRREGNRPVLPPADRAPPPKAQIEPPDNNGPPATDLPKIVIYGASWCGACHEAAAYLKSRHIPFVEKDIEQDPAAAREMQQKLARAGERGGSIPVIDVGGRILIGFSASSLERALRVSARGTVL